MMEFGARNEMFVGSYVFVLRSVMNLISVKNLEKTYQTGEVTTRVLRGLSFDIKKGEFVSIMGPSGSGKSTLLHMLGFLDTPTNGTYHFDKKEIQKYTDEERAHLRNKRMGFVFQTFNLLPRLSVRDNVALPLLYSDVPEREWHDRVESAVKTVSMEHRIDYDQMQLSGGERQRVAIARALVNKPDVIFADEPTGNLDTNSGEQVMSTLEKLHEKGHTVLLITHETYTANYADRIIHLLDGQIDREEHVEKRARVGHRTFQK